MKDEDTTHTDRARFRQMMSSGTTDPVAASGKPNGSAAPPSVEDFDLEEPDDFSVQRPEESEEKTSLADTFARPPAADSKGPKLSFAGAKKAKQPVEPEIEPPLDDDPEPMPEDEPVANAAPAGAPAFTPFAAKPKTNATPPEEPETVAEEFAEPEPHVDAADEPAETETVIMAAPPPQPQTDEKPAEMGQPEAKQAAARAKSAPLDDDLFEELPEGELEKVLPQKPKKEAKPAAPRRPTMKKKAKKAASAAPQPAAPGATAKQAAPPPNDAKAQDQARSEPPRPEEQPAPDTATADAAQSSARAEKPEPSQPMNDLRSELRKDSTVQNDLRQLDRDLGLDTTRRPVLPQEAEEKSASRRKRKPSVLVQQIPGAVVGLGLGVVGGFFAGIGLTDVPALASAFVESGHLIAAFLGACIAVLGAFRASQHYMGAANRRIEAERKLEERRRAEAAQRDDARWHREMLGVAGALKYELIQIEGNARLSVAMGTAILPHRPQGLTRDETLRIFRPPQISAFERLSEKITFLPLEVADAVYGAYSRAQQRLFILALIEQEPQTHRSPDATKTMIKEFQALQKAAMDALRRLHDAYTPEEPLKLIHEDFNADGTQKGPADGAQKQAAQ